MRHIFIGDISVSRQIPPENVLFHEIFNNADMVLADLEGAIFSPDELAAVRLKKLAIYNSPDVLNMLDLFHVNAVWLANNHLFDMPVSISQTIKTLSENGIKSFGAGSDLMNANLPLVFSKESTTSKYFAFGWNVIGCHNATVTSEGVNPYNPSHLLNTIRRLRKIDSNSFVVFIMHWNYELELYPQPAHRQLAFDLIDEGVDAIVGLHPHVVQGAELIKGKPVVYSLGNWFFPSRQLGHFHLKFPLISNRELALYIENKGRQILDVKFYWHQFDRDYNRIAFEKVEDWDGEILNSLTPFFGMNNTEYLNWFKHNRLRKKFLPVYANYQNYRQNLCKDSWVKLRQKMIETLILFKVKQKLAD